MGTYTTNYKLFMPTVGEQGWGELVNGNFTTIDAAMKSLSNDIGTLETETDAVEERVTTIENRMGTGTYIANAKVPIMIKLTTTDEGYGVFNATNANETTPLFGFHVINADDTQTMSVTGSTNYTGDQTISVYGINRLTGEERFLKSMATKYSGSKTVSGITVKYVEYVRATGNSFSVTGYTRPAIYVGSPE